MLPGATFALHPMGGEYINGRSWTRHVQEPHGTRVAYTRVVSVVYWTGEVERQLQKYSQVLRDIIWISVEDFIAQVGTIRDSEVRNKSVARRKSPLSPTKTDSLRPKTVAAIAASFANTAPFAVICG